jgi:hypothetical protein
VPVPKLRVVSLSPTFCRPRFDVVIRRRCHPSGNQRAPAIARSRRRNHRTGGRSPGAGLSKGRHAAGVDAGVLSDFGYFAGAFSHNTSIGRLSASALSHHSLCWATFITNIAESDFRYTQGVNSSPSAACSNANGVTLG